MHEVKNQIATDSESCRELYTARPVQARVIERHLDGASNRQIAKEEGLDRDTVSRILSQRELVEMRAEQQSRLQCLASKALLVFEEALSSPDARLAVAIATKILEGTGVMDGRGLQGTIDDSIQREVMRKTTLLPEFQQGPTEFVRSKSKKNSGKSELLWCRNVRPMSGTETKATFLRTERRATKCLERVRFAVIENRRRSMRRS